MVPKKNKTWRPWLLPEEIKLLALVESGLRYEDIAAQMPGRSTAACQYHNGVLLRKRNAPAQQRPAKEHTGRNRRTHKEMLAAVRQQPPLAAQPLFVPFEIAVAIITGDPMPGRSALDRQKLEQQTGVSR